MYSLRALDLVVRIGERRLEVVRDVLVELVVLLFGDLGLRARPQRARLVDRLVLVRWCGIASCPCPTPPFSSGSAA